MTSDAKRRRVALPGPEEDAGDLRPVEAGEGPTAAAWTAGGWREASRRGRIASARSGWPWPSRAHGSRPTLRQRGLVRGQRLGFVEEAVEPRGGMCRQSTPPKSDSLRPERARPSPSPSATSRAASSCATGGERGQDAADLAGPARAPTTSASGRRSASPPALAAKSRSSPEPLEQAGGVGRRRAEHGGPHPGVGRVAPGDRGEAVESRRRRGSRRA